MRLGKAMTWDDMANAYKELYGQSTTPRCMPMDSVYDAVVKHPDKFYEHPKKGTVHRILQEGGEK